MAHPRKLIRSALISRLKEPGATACGDRVFGNRAQSIPEKKLPALLVYTQSESSEISIDSPREYKRTLRVAIEVVAASEENLDDVLDSIAEQVENAVFRDETFGGTVSDTVLGETDIDLIAEGERPIGAAKISLEMTYYSHLPAGPSAPLDAFESAGMRIDLPPGDGEAEIEGSAELPQP